MSNEMQSGYVCRACFRPAEVLVTELGSLCSRCWKWLGWNKIKNPIHGRMGPGYKREYYELLEYLEDCNENPEVIEKRLEIQLEGEIKGENNV